jgi:hypothetical protein
MLHRCVSLLFLAVCAVPAHAGGFELSNVIEKFGGQFSEAGVWVQTVFAFLGFCLVGIGLVMWARGAKEGAGAGDAAGGKRSWQGVVVIVFGALLLIMIPVIEMVLQSSLGTSVNTLDRIGL